jgi:hypothetical protein
MTRRAFTATITNRSIRLLTFAAITALSQVGAFAAQTWTYQFTPTANSQPYNVSCGECGLPFTGSNADVAGTFTILLDWDSNKGKILSLDDHLVNVVDVLFYRDIGVVNVPSNPSYRDYGIIPSGSAELFAVTSVTYTNGLGHMKSDGRIPLHGGGYRLGKPYEVWFTPTAATLNMTVPIDDWYITVTGATAAFMSSAWSGDLNNDGRVDKRDYVLLRNSTGPEADYDAWRWSYGNTYFGAGSATLPEPTAAVLVLCSAAALLLNCRRLRSSR